MPWDFARLRLFDGWPSDNIGQPSSPTTSTDVCLVTPRRGVPPLRRTSANASSRFIAASRPLKATLRWNGDESGSGAMHQQLPGVLARARLFLGGGTGGGRAA